MNHLIFRRMATTGLALVLGLVSLASRAEEFTGDACSKCDAETCKLPGTLAIAEANLAAADDALEAALAAVERAQKDVDAATSGGEAKTEIAAKALINAKAALAKAQNIDGCREEQRERIDLLLTQARTWRYGVAPGGVLATSADGWNRAGGELLFLWHPAIRREWGLALRYERNERDNKPTQKWADAQVRWGINGQLLSVMFGLGFARDSLAHKVITSHASLGLRYGQWVSSSNATFLSDARVFMEPWFPTDGTPATVFFGIEIVGGIGWDRIGAQYNLKYGEDQPLPNATTPKPK